MKRQLANLHRLALSRASTAAYRCGHRKFHEFCKTIRASPLPASKDTVALFAAHISRSLLLASVKVYLAAVSLLHRRAGLSSPTRNNPSLQLALRGLTRAHATQPSSTTREPITLDVLQHLLLTLKSSKPWCKQERTMFAAAMCLAFFGFLRGREITAPSKRQFDPHWHLTPGDITMSYSDNCLYFRLKCSKTDQLHREHTITLHTTPCELCPVRIIKKYVDRYSTIQTQPLFTHCDGRPMSLQRFRQRLKQLLDLAGLPSKNFNTHSLRIGAATSAAREGVSARRIKQLGRWRSQAYLLYIR